MQACAFEALAAAVPLPTDTRSAVFWTIGGCAVVACSTSWVKAIAVATAAGRGLGGLGMDLTGEDRRGTAAAFARRPVAFDRLQMVDLVFLVGVDVA